MQWFILLVWTLLISRPFALADWSKIEGRGRGGTVRFHAWGGSPEINRYLQWCAAQLKQLYKIELIHVPVKDPSETVALLQHEANQGRFRQGSADLIWINGENFRLLKSGNLLYGPFTKILPNMEYVDITLPVENDFTVAVDGYEAPWGMGQLNFIYDSELIKAPPAGARDFLNYARQFPGRLTYPYPDGFHGYSFLKQILLDLFDEQPDFYQPVTESGFLPYAEALFDFLDQLHPLLYPEFSNGSAHERQLLLDGKIDMAIQFNPFSSRGMITQGHMRHTVKNTAFARGSLTNCHFLAIPRNSDQKNASLLVINFLLSAQAQGEKAKPEIWGDPYVLDREKLPRHLRHLLPVQNLYFPLSEPHPSWQTTLQRAWFRRYGPRR